MLSRWVRLCESDNLRLRLCVLGRELFPQEEIDQCAHGKSDGQDNRFVGNDCFQRGEAGAGAETKPCEERFIAYGEADAQGEKANEHTPELVKGIDLAEGAVYDHPKAEGDGDKGNEGQNEIDRTDRSGGFNKRGRITKGDMGDSLYTVGGLEGELTGHTVIGDDLIGGNVSGNAVIVVGFPTGLGEGVRGGALKGFAAFFKIGTMLLAVDGRSDGVSGFEIACQHGVEIGFTLGAVHSIVDYAVTADQYGKGEENEQQDGNRGANGFFHDEPPC